MLRERLARLVPPMLRAVRGSAEDEAAFDAYRTTMTTHLGVLASVIIFLFTVIWWPTDPLVMPDERHVAVFFDLRVRAVVVEVAALLVFAVWRPGGRVPLVAAPLFYAALMATFGYSLGELGGPDLTWLANAYLGVVPAAFIPLRLPGRLLGTAIIAAALPLAFFLPFPANWAAPTAQGQVSFLVFAALFTVAIGELYLRIMRRAFFDRRAADATSAELAALTDSLSATVAERTSDLRALALHLDGVQEGERRRIARELHDNLGQGLTAMRYTVARLEDRVARRPDEAQALIEDLAALIDGTTSTVRGFVSTLRPRILDDLGLLPAAEWLRDYVVKTAGLPCELVASDAFRAAVAADDGHAFDADVNLVAFRVLQEGSTNALKHGAPGHLTLGLDLVGDALVASVADDGLGFDAAAATEGFGLLGLRERVHACGGRFTVTTAPGQGARLAAEIPLAPVPAAIAPATIGEVATTEARP